MGVERSVTRWYLYRQLILDEIAQLEVKLMPPSTEMAVEESEDAAREDDANVNLEALSLQLAEARKKLKGLGHCPKPMMG